MQGAGEIADVAGWQVGPFIQDDWKILPNLTIDLGLRWDPNTPPVSKNGRGAVGTRHQYRGWFCEQHPWQAEHCVYQRSRGASFPR